MVFALLDCAPSAASYGARPLDPLEIDQHPDSARIWATIRDLRDAASCSSSDAQEILLDIEREEGFSAGFIDCANRLHNLNFTIKNTEDALSFGHSLSDDKCGGMIDALDVALDRLAAELSDLLDTRSDDLAAIAAARSAGAQALSDLRAEIDTAAEEKKLDWRIRHDLRQGRYSDESLARILKKDELARITVIAMRALFNMARAA